MSDKIWQKISDFLGLLPIGAMFGVLVYVANVEIRDLDLWLHLGVGKFIIEHHQIPVVDFLSCSIAGKPWVNHEWLFQVILYRIYDLFGIDGLAKLQTVLVGITALLLLLLGYSKERQLTTGLLLLFVFLIYQQRFTLRPDLFSLFFFVVYIFVLSLHLDKRWAMVVLFVTQVLWSNSHGFFFFGPLFIAIGLIAEWIKRHVKLPYEWNETGRLNDQEYKRLKIILAVVFLACLVNPYFIRGALYPIGVFFSLSGENKIFFSYIQELQKPITGDTLFFNDDRFIFYKVLIVLSTVSFIFNRRKIDISALLFWLVFLIFSLKAGRNTPFFAFAAYLVIITNMLSLSYKDFVPIRFLAKRYQHITAAIGKIFLLLWVFHYGNSMAGRVYYDFDQYKDKSEFGGISQRNYPNKAVDFLVMNKIKGNFFNDFNAGAYLIGRTFPDIKVFIDGRTEVYGGNFFIQYQDIMDKGNMKTFEAVIEKNKITGIFLSSIKQQIPGSILKYLEKKKEWRLVYFDYDAVIYLKDVPQNQKIIEGFAINLDKYKARKEDLVKLGPLPEMPYRSYMRAFTLETMDRDEAALNEAKEAIRIAPDYADAYQVIGKVYAKRKNFRRAFENFRLAVMYNSSKKLNQYNLALSYYDLHEYPEAIKRYEIITRTWPGEVRGYYFLAKSYARNKEYDKALNALRRAKQLNPKDAGDIIHVGDIIFDQKDYARAKEVYDLAVEPDDRSAAIHHKLGGVFNAQGDFKKARQEYQKALSLDPDNNEIQEDLEILERSGSK